MSVKLSRDSSDPLAGTIRRLVELIGEDPAREGLVDTPRRVAESMRFLTEGYAADPRAIIGDALFEAGDYDDMVIVKDIDFFSLCEHHLLPFFGRAHVAYLPAAKVVGLSKIPRVVDAFAHRLQLQERLTRDIAGALEEVLQPLGVAVVIEGRHLCIEMRGVQKSESHTVTSCMLGTFRRDARTRTEFLEHLRR